MIFDNAKTYFIIAKCWKKLLDFSYQDERDDLALAELQRKWIESQTGAITDSLDILNMLLPQVRNSGIHIILSLPTCTFISRLNLLTQM